MAKKKEATVVDWQPKEPAYVIRTCNADGTAHSGFVWPESGFVEAPDWKPSAECGNGLHGLIDGLGDYSLLSNAHDARWQVVLVNRAECVQIDDSKVKFPHGIVEYSGNMATALTRISQEWMKLLIKATWPTQRPRARKRRLRVLD